MNLITKSIIEDRISLQPHLKLLEASLFDIPRRLRELDEDAFIVYNQKRHVPEIHTLANKGNTFFFVGPSRPMDGRVLETFKQYNNKVRSAREIAREIDRHNDELARSNDRHRRNDINSWARDNRSAFKKFAEEVY